MSRIRVLIVEDSAVVREHLRRIISNDPRLEVAGMAASGEDALVMVERLSPNVISMDIQLPGIQGFEVTRRIMAHRPTPIVVVSAVDSDEINLTMEALKAGALSVVEKPVSTSHQDYEAMAGRLCTQLAIMSEVQVIRRRETVSSRASSVRPVRAPGGMPFRVLGVAASTGGPSAILHLLSGLGANFPLPIVIVQHMTAGFIDGFAEWLRNVTRLPVSIVTASTPLLAGHVYLAPADSHLVVEGSWGSVDNTPPVGVHRPSATVLFSSMAKSLGPAGIGVLLTGMGEDGATGLRDLRHAGGFTVAEDASTAVVYGMPAAGMRLGAACESLPMGEIAPRILQLVAAKSELA